MRCTQVKSHWADLFEDAPSGAMPVDVEAHLRDCPACRAEWERMREAWAALSPTRPLSASLGFKERVMNATATTCPAPQSSPSRGLFGRLGRPVLAACAALALLIAFSLGGWLTFMRDREPMTAFAALNEAANAMSDLKSVHIKAQMRGRVGDNFEQICLENDLLPIEMWKAFGAPPRWRAEKPGRVAVMDGQSTTLWIESEKMVATFPAEAGGLVGWIIPLMDADTLLSHELELAQRNDEQLSLTRQSDASGAETLELRIEASAEGDYSKSDVGKGGSILTSDNLRVYQFDAKTKRLKGLQVYVHAPKGDILVLEVTDIAYDIPLAPALFALDIPQDANRFVPPQTSGAVPEAKTPEDMARAFFEACAAADWERALRYMPFERVPEEMKFLGGLQLIQLGTPTQSGLYEGWFVPYEIKLKSGEMKKGDLAVRNDNLARQYVFDGGI